MKILAVSDEVIERLYDARVRMTYPDVRMILGCGDLPFSYLEFLLTVMNVPLYYVPGNHDPDNDARRGSHVQGGINLDGQVMLANGLLIAGLGGSIMYQANTSNQYTQQEMFIRAYQLLPKIYLKTLKYKRSVDIFVTHSPPAGIHDDTDPAHLGLQALNFLLRVVKPRFLLHGHTMFYKNNIKSHITQYYQTQVINIFPFRVIDINL